MKEEIGGYFELEKLKGNEYHKNLISLNCGRNALDYLFRARKIEKVYLPAFLCDSVKAMCEKNGYVYEIYHIDENFCPIFEKNLGADEYIYIVNFYGLFCQKDIVVFREKYKNIIWDNTHAFYQSAVEGIDTIYSCRKFFGVPDGAYLATTVTIDERLEKDISSDRFKHLLGRFEGKASDFYADFKANNAGFKTAPLKSMSDLTHNLLGAIDYEAAAQKRKNNFKILNDAFKDINKINVENIDIPYAYPLYIKNGMKIKKKLAEKGIYVATLWPNVFEGGNELEKDFAENILPLPIDQRYGDKEMEYLIREVKRCIN